MYTVYVTESEQSSTEMRCNESTTVTHIREDIYNSLLCYISRLSADSSYFILRD
jgi:hypothetical protein